MSARFLTSIWHVCVLVLAGIIGLASFASAQTLTWLGAPEAWENSTAEGVSSDGQTVVGYFTPAGTYLSRAFRWTSRFGSFLLDPRYEGSTATAVSGDGNTVVGRAYLNNDATNRNFPFVWFAFSIDLNGDGYNDLIRLNPPDTDDGVATDLSEDGQIIVGYYKDENGNNQAFWRTDQGFIVLGTLGGSTSAALAISPDGSVVVGSSENSFGNTHAFRWTSNEGIQPLSTLFYLSYTHMVASDVSSQGKYIVGWADRPTSERVAYLYKTINGVSTVELLGSLGGLSTAATAVSDNGVVVGYGENALGQVRAFRWTEQTGIQDLTALYGHLLDSGSYFLSALDISKNGEFIVGKAYHAANDKTEAFLLHAPITTATETALLPEAPALLTPAPNPFAAATTIRYDLPAPTTVRLEVVDLYGRTVAVLVDGPRPAGSHYLYYQPDHLAGGLYFLQLTVGARRFHQKMVYLGK
ncbi:HAF repeat-containing protein [Rhodothermus marinus]|uniref:Extracellular repeat protein, HAF family n=1 Tax=Rhodothermus marinus (strain ATCC 43812 / DSM 4252 / R-10) TaxID=518766 RepID=D0MDP1_RHOM4|nr:HAF repeat-containing protein [Rhodothermus marinus]ACY47234.1 extracellular repeat protein, HAF family [Rhodothermus marinus DSM 4252]